VYSYTLTELQRLRNEVGGAIWWALVGLL
jgi:hypothetical protein